MKLTKLIFIILCIAIITSSCKSIKEGLSGQKKANSDEFLIQKKNPLVLPPHFGDLPQPANEEDDIDNENNEIDLSKIFEESNDKKIIDESDTSIEQSILKKLIIIDAN